MSEQTQQKQLPGQVSGEELVEVVKKALQKERTQYEELVLDQILPEVLKTTDIHCWKVFLVLLQRGEQQDFRPTEVERNFIKRLYSKGEGFSMNDLAYIFSRSSETIHRILKDLPDTPNNQDGSTNDLEEVLEEKEKVQ